MRCSPSSLNQPLPADEETGTLRPAQTFPSAVCDQIGPSGEVRIRHDEFIRRRIDEDRHASW